MQAVTVGEGDQQLLLTGSSDKTVKVWDVSSSSGAACLLTVNATNPGVWKFLEV